MMKKMRKADDVLEIETVLKHYRENKKSLLLWQNPFPDNENSRTKYKGDLSIIDLKNKSIKLRYSSLGHGGKIDPFLPLYLLGEHKTLVLKAMVVSLKNDEVSILPPETVRMEEMRAIKRFNTLKIKNCTISVHKQFGTSNKLAENIFKLGDISEYGFSFLVNQNSKDHFLQFEQIYVDQIMNDKMPALPKGEIRHISALTLKESLVDVKLFKIGVKFKQKMELKDLYVYRKFFAEA